VSHTHTGDKPALRVLHPFVLLRLMRVWRKAVNAWVSPSESPFRRCPGTASFLVQARFRGTDGLTWVPNPPGKAGGLGHPSHRRGQCRT